MQATNLSRRIAITGLCAAAAASATIIPSQATATECDPDRAGIVARTEAVIQTLRDSYVCSGWKMDEDGAGQTLRYVRSGDFDNGGDPDFVALLRFCSEHNQSLDWIFQGNPGVMVCQLAGLSEQAARQVDPIFAAVERFEAAYEFFGQCIDKSAAIDSIIWERAEKAAEPRMPARIEFEAANPEYKFAEWETQDKLRSSFRYEELRKLDDTPEAQEARAIEQTGGDAAEQAAIDLANTVPTTAEGAVHLLKYITDENGGAEAFEGYQDKNETPVEILVMKSLLAFLSHEPLPLI